MTMAEQPSNDPQDLRQADLSHLWHPFTNINAFAQEDFPIIERGRGVWLYDVAGKAYLDGTSSWWCVNLGHSYPPIVAAIKGQADRLQQSILGGMSHPGAINLARRIASLPPRGLDRVYFCSDGASATEAAMRMAIEYWHHRGCPEKTELIALADAYHGDTRGAVGAGYVKAFHAPIRRSLRLAHQADSPHCFACRRRDGCDLHCFDSMRQTIELHHEKAAAVIIEPLCQGAAGMRIYPAEYLRRLRQLCDRYDLLLIADEIAVGCGRTGSMFACEKAGIVSDFMCLGKGLTGGTLPMSAVRCRQSIYDSFRDGPDSVPRTFFHGHTFGGNPIAAAAALAALATYERPGFLAEVAGKADILRRGISDLAGNSGIKQGKALGMMSALQIAGGAAAAGDIARYARSAGLMIRPLGDILYLWPPLTSSAGEMAMMLERLDWAVGKYRAR